MRTDRTRILAHVRANPDSTCRKIAEALGLQTLIVSAELKLLRDEGRVQSGGKQTRGTKWRCT
jgi:predicted transcriptional regulator